MTEVLEAMAARDEQRLRFAAALFEAQELHGVKQSELVRQTGYTRETIRRYVEDEKIRRGLMSPTPRYVAEQERRERRARS